MNPIQPSTVNALRKKRRMRLWIIVGALVLIWLAWDPIRALFTGGRVSYSNSPEGVWVGEMDITGGADHANLGDTTGPHKHAVLYAKLDIENRFMDEYAGPGELFIIGEQQPRKMDLILRLTPNNNGLPNADAYVVTHPPIAGPLSHCHYEQNEITITSNGILDLQFKATLHRGSVSEYRSLLSRLQRQ
jgi:hypothetical protein